MSAVLRPFGTRADVEADDWSHLAVSIAALRDEVVDARVWSERSAKRPPIIIVGAGPAAQECARQLTGELDADDWVLMINGELYNPYHRAQLSTVLSTGCGADELLANEFATNVMVLSGVSVTEIEPEKKKVLTADGVKFSYRKLVLATGSLSRRPIIPGLFGARIVDFRNLSDVEMITALAPRRVAVLGGGLLGIEAARALRRYCDEVVIFIRSSHVLSRQVDRGAGERIAAYLLEAGIEVKADTHLDSAESNDHQVTLMDQHGRPYLFDVVICATGIDPNIGLAAHAHLQYHLGIEVNEAQQTSEPDIYAIGECSEHHGKIAGNLSVSLEQARRAAASILHKPAPNINHIDVFQLKMDGCVVAAIGCVNDVENEDLKVFRPDKRFYFRVFIKDQRVVGAIVVASNVFDFSAFTDAVERQLPWTDTIEKRFLKTGQLPHHSNVLPDTVMCFCTGTTYGKLCELRDAGLGHDAIIAETGASQHCGSCAQRIAVVTMGESRVTGRTEVNGLWISVVMSLLLLVALVVGMAIPFSARWQSSWRLVDTLWRNEVVRQVTGYSLLSLLLLAFIPAWKRRAQREQRKPQSRSLISWHVLAVTSVMIVFTLHTGVRIGHGANAQLGIMFATTLLLGGAAALTWRSASRSTSHRRVAENIRALHWALLFPLPIVLVFHLVQVYYF